MSNAPVSPGRAHGDSQGSRILVIGCGFIGSNVAIEIARGGRPPTVLTRSLPPDEVVAAVGEDRLHLGDAADVETVVALLDGIDHVAFCAGGLLPLASEAEPERDREMTARPVAAVLEALHRRPGVTLTYLSSGGTVYGNPSRLPAREGDPARPVSAYGRLHLACEEMIESARSDGLRTRILRCSTVYGEHQLPERGQGAVPTFLHRIERGEPIDLYGGGATIRDYIYVEDVARAMVGLIGLEDGPALINVGSGEGTSLLELLRLIESEVGRPAEVVQHAERPFEVHQIVLDTTLLRETLNLRLTPLPEGIARTHRWLLRGAPERT